MSTRTLLPAVVGCMLLFGCLADRSSNVRGRLNSASFANAAAAGGFHALGPKSVLVLTLRSSTSTTRCTNATMDAIVFTDKRSASPYSGSVAAFYSENSYGQMTMSGQVSGPYTVDVTLPCTLTNMKKWADAADSAATAAGVNVKSFSSKMYLMPPDSQCGPPAGQVSWGGWTIGNRVWIRDDQCDSKFILAHELGHTFGASHSSIPGSMNEATYGDASSNMGGLLLLDDPTTLYIWNRTAHWNAPGKINAGWLTGNSVQTVSVGGSYRVAMLEQAPSTDPQVLKIGTTYISYRRAVGYDSDLWNVCGFHAGGWAACTPGQYVDSTSVHTGGNGRETILLANLGDGQSFTDGSGVTVTQTKHDSLYAYLTVTFSARKPVAPGAVK